MRIHLHVERLVVRGLWLTATDRAELEASFRAELGKLLTSADGRVEWARLGHQPYVQARPVRYQIERNPIGLGTALAQSVFGVMRQSRQPGAHHEP